MLRDCLCDDGDCGCDNMDDDADVGDNGPRIIDFDWSAIIHSNGLIGER